MLKYLFTFLMIIFSVALLKAQTVNGGFSTSINVPQYSVTLHAEMESGSGSAGVLTLEFSYNTDDLSFPASPLSGTDYVLHGDFASYVTKNITRPATDRIRISLVTTGTPVPVPLSTSPTNIITLYLTITDEAGSSNLTWVQHSIAPAFLSPNYTSGTWNDLNNSPLPVELTSFYSEVDKNSINLKWHTVSEVQNYGFEIERKAVAGDWQKIGFVEGRGNSNSPAEYQFNDANPTGGSKFLYRLKQIDTDGQFTYSVEVEAEIIPDQFEMFQNYPNPFNPNTVIRFSVPKATELKINVYSVLGEKVLTAAEGIFEPGFYETEINGLNLSSGTYIYRIESSDFVQTKKMMLLK